MSVAQKTTPCRQPSCHCKAQRNRYLDNVQEIKLVKQSAHQENKQKTLLVTEQEDPGYSGLREP